MSSKNKRRLSAAERERRKEAQHKQRMAAMVEDTVSMLSCPVAVARDLAEQCLERQAHIDVDLTFACLAHDLWVGRATPPEAAVLGPLLTDLVAEQLRHARTMLELERRFEPLLQDDHHAHHEHLAADVVDPAYVARMLNMPPEDQPIRKALEEAMLSTAMPTYASERQAAEES